jgi:hypothetical protein
MRSKDFDEARLGLHGPYITELPRSDPLAGWARGRRCRSHTVLLLHPRSP